MKEKLVKSFSYIQYIRTRLLTRGANKPSKYKPRIGVANEPDI